MLWLRWGVVVGIVVGMCAGLLWVRRPTILDCEQATDRYGWQQAAIMGACHRQP